MGRALVVGALVLAAALVSSITVADSPAAPTCQPTQSDIAGPFQGTGVPSPRRAKIGKGHVLLVRVLRSPDCAPVSGALVELWQAGPGGPYDTRGRGSVVTGRSGTFRFQGPRPPSYEGRPPHIHISVNAAGYEVLLGRYEVPRGKSREMITLLLKSLL